MAQLQQRVYIFLKYNQTALHIAVDSCCSRHSAEGSQESLVYCSCRELVAVAESTVVLQHNGVNREPLSHIPQLVPFFPKLHSNLFQLGVGIDSGLAGKPLSCDCITVLRQQQREMPEIKSDSYHA